MLFQMHITCAARCAGNRGIIEPYELEMYDGLDVKVWDWGPDVTRCAPAVVLVVRQCTASDAAPAHAAPPTVACRYPSSSLLL